MAEGPCLVTCGLVEKRSKRAEAAVWEAEARGDQHRVWWDGQLVLERRDPTVAGAGSVGVWTKADSVKYFDDLTVEPL